MKILNALLILFLSINSTFANEFEHKGVVYPQGKKSFADKVIAFYPGSNPADKKYQHQKAVLGKPDYNSKNMQGMLSLGCNGSITVEFTNNELADDQGKDLYIVEVGLAFEDAKVEISQNGNQWISVGTLKSDGKKIDIAGKAQKGVSYRFVKVTDLASDCTTETRGADIDAIATLNRPLSEIPASFKPAVIQQQQAGVIKGTDNDNCADPDADGDGIDAIACGGSDCDDNDPSRYPGNVEVADPYGVDEDCDASTHGGKDEDGDGFTSQAGFNIAQSGETISGRDCNDQRADISPMAQEICDGIDNNCDGKIDEGVKVEFYQDKDGDLFGNPKVKKLACHDSEYFEGTHWVRNKEDCDDNNPKVNPITGTCR